MHALVALLALATPSVAQTPPPAPAATARIRIEPRVEPFLDLWFSARAAGAGSGEVPEGFRPVGALFQKLGQDLGSPLAWAPIEGRIATCRSAAEARAAFADLPETQDRRAGEPLKLRARAIELADALAAIEPEFREKLWPADEARIRTALRDLERGLLAHADEVFALHARALGFEGLDLAIPCALVARMPEPGAITHRGAGGKGVCFVAVHELSGSALAEVVLHEATHALDVARDGDLFDQLRERLEAAGVARTDRLWRDAPHTLMFCASASTVRQALDREHADHGQASGYYAKVGATAVAVRGAWAEIESKALGRSAALEVLVAAVAPSRPADPPAGKAR